MLDLIRLKVGSLRTNCYLVFDQKTKECLVIDPGDEAEYISEVIIKNELKPRFLVATHGHFDHVLAVAELQLNFNTPFFINKKDEFLLRSAKSRASYFLENDKDLLEVKRNRFLKYGDTLKIGEQTLKVIETPGHTPGSICLYSRKFNMIFVGDLIFAGGYFGRTDLSYSSKGDLEKSIKKIKKLDKNCVAYAGHGEEFLLLDVC